jgi:hypothetical protein
LWDDASALNEMKGCFSQMNVQKIVLGLLAGALALSAFASASASAALPEFTPKTSFLGSFGSSKFELEGSEFAYSNGTFSGNMPTTSTISETNFVFNLGKKACYTKGEEMVWTGLKGKLAYINKEKKEVGLSLGEPVSTPIVTCIWTPLGYREEKISGALIAQITPVNTKTRKFKLKIFQGHGEKEFTKFESQEAYPLLWGNYSCIKIGEKETCTGSGRKVGIEVAAVNMTTTVETEIQA